MTRYTATAPVSPGGSGTATAQPARGRARPVHGRCGAAQAAVPQPDPALRGDRKSVV